MLKQSISTVRLFLARYSTKGKIKCLTNCIVSNEPAQEFFYQDLLSSNIFVFSHICRRRCCRLNLGDKTVITKTRLYNFDPLKPHFYTVKLGFIGVYIIFLISAQNIDCGYSLEPPRRGGSNEYPQSMFLSRNMKNIRIFYLIIFIFWW